MKNDKHEKEVLLEKILKDPIFSTGEYYHALLQYLYQCYQEKYEPTEIDLAINVFRKKKDFNPTEDTLVRVHFYRLRKKLEQYYNTTGKDDPIRLTIPRGHHSIKFITASAKTSLWKGNIYSPKLFIISGFLILLIIIFYLGNQLRTYKKTIEDTNNHIYQNIIWSDFANSELRTSIVIGELFAFYVHKEAFNHEWLVRDDQINSYNELHAFINETKFEDQSNIYLPGWDIVPKSSVTNVIEIYNVLAPIKERLDFKITSEVSLEDIRHNNIIFIGHFHNLKHLNQYLPNERFHPHTQYLPSQRHPQRYIHVTTAKIDTIYYLTFHYGQTLALNNDYVLVSKVPGPNYNVILFIVSFLPLGRLETIKMLTDKNLLDQLKIEVESSAETFTPYFEMLIEVKGYAEKGFETNVKHFFSLASK